MKYNPQIKDQKMLSSGQWNGTCPNCNKENHFYMNSKNGLWDCKSCGEKGNWYIFVKRFKKGFEKKKKRIKVTQNLKDTKLKFFDKRKVIKKILSEKENEKLEPPKTIVLPSYFKLINKNNKETKRALEYILSRNYDYETILKYGLLYGGNIGNFFNRLIIPIYNDNSLKGYLGRWIPLEGVENVKRKYRNSYKTDFSHLLGNYDLINPQHPVIICEGAFSAWRINYNSVYSFGKKLSNYQIFLLKRKKAKEIVLAFDSDAQSEIIKISKVVKDNGFTTRMFFLKEGDPDDLDNSDGKLYERILDESFLFVPKKTVPIKKIKIF